MSKIVVINDEHIVVDKIASFGATELRTCGYGYTKIEVFVSVKTSGGDIDLECGSYKEPSYNQNAYEETEKRKYEIIEQLTKAIEE